MKRFLYDTAVFVYALGGEHPLRAPCRQILELAAAGALRGEASVEMIQELAHVRGRRPGSGRGEVVQEAQDAAALCLLHELGEADLRLALALFRSQPALGMRDAIHAATALNRGISHVLSPDRAFEQVPGLERVDPASAQSVLLAG